MTNMPLKTPFCVVLASVLAKRHSYEVLQTAVTLHERNKNVQTEGMRLGTTPGVPRIFAGSRSDATLLVLPAWDFH